MKIRPILPLFVLLASSVAFAQVQTFAFGKVAARQQVTWESESSLETMVGKSHTVSGTIKFDPKAKTGSCSVTVDAASITTGVKLRDEHMHSDQWLNVKKFPKITFTSTKIKLKSGSTYAVTGNFTLHGVTKLITVDVDLKYLPESAETKKAKFAGNVVRAVTQFTVRMSQYGIKVPENAAGKVSDDLTISLDIFACTK